MNDATKAYLLLGKNYRCVYVPNKAALIYSGNVLLEFRDQRADLDSMPNVARHEVTVHMNSVRHILDIGRRVNRIAERMENAYSRNDVNSARLLSRRLKHKKGVFENAGAGLIKLIDEELKQGEDISRTVWELCSLGSDQPHHYLECLTYKN